MLPKPYLKLLKTINKIKVFAVDGAYIRTRIDSQFTNFGQHYRFPFIPRNEFWLDREANQGETQYFVDHLLVEWELMRQGKKYEVALAQADRVEQRERAKSVLLDSVQKNPKKLPRLVYRRMLKLYSRGCAVWLVNGEAVRDFFYIDFTEGGHDLVYKFVPARQIWLDDDLTATERKYVFLHELHERNLMAQGWNYSRAHDSASAIEQSCRLAPQLLQSQLAKEFSLDRQLAGDR